MWATNRSSPRFRAMFFRKKTLRRARYLQIVENRREDGAVRQQVIATLGRLEDLRQSGQLERLLRSGARFADKAIVVGAVADGEATTSPARRIGAALVFERLWQETGCRAVVESLAGSRQHDFPLERAVFLTVLHRLVFRAARIAPPTAGGRITGSRASSASACTTSTAPWAGSAKNSPNTSRRAQRPLRRVA